MQKFYLIPRVQLPPILLILIIDEPNKPDVSIGGWREGTFIGSSSCLAYTNQLLPLLPIIIIMYSRGQQWSIRSGMTAIVTPFSPSPVYVL